jgi:O-antigen/teichoic acid export membrane protein
MRLGKSTTVYFLSQVGLTVAGFVATFFIARFLGADTLGVYSVAIAVLYWLNVPAAAVGSAINKRVSEGRDGSEHLSAGLLTNLSLAAVLAAAVLLLGSYVDAYIGADVHVLLSILVVANVVYISVSSSLDGQKRVATRGLLQSGERVVRTTLQILFVIAGFHLGGLLLGHAVSLLIGAAVGVALFRFYPTRPAREHIRNVLSYAKYSWLGTLKGRAFGWMDTTVLAFFVASSLIGVYNVAWTLTSTLVLASNAVRQTLFPEFSELGVDEDHQRIHHYLEEGLVFTGVFAIPGFFGAAVLGPRLLKIYSPEFTQGATVLLILIIARTGEAFGSQFISAINAIDRPDVAFKINLVFVAANLLLNVILVWQFGWYGAAVATALSAGVAAALSYVALSRLIGRPNMPLGEIARETGAGVSMAAVVYGLMTVLPRSHYGTIALVGVGAVVYGVVLVSISTRVRSKALALLPFTEPA